MPVSSFQFFQGVGHAFPAWHSRGRRGLCWRKPDQRVQVRGHRGQGPGVQRGLPVHVGRHGGVRHVQIRRRRSCRMPHGGLHCVAGSLDLCLPSSEVNTSQDVSINRNVSHASTSSHALVSLSNVREESVPNDEGGSTMQGRVVDKQHITRYGE